jgi:hypothetical protein
VKIDEEIRKCSNNFTGFFIPVPEAIIRKINNKDAGLP